VHFVPRLWGSLLRAPLVRRDDTEDLFSPERPRRGERADRPQQAEVACLWRVAGPAVPVKAVAAEVAGYTRRFTLVSSATGPHLVRLALSDPDDKPFVGLWKVGNIKAHKLASPHGTGKANEEKCPVPDTEEGVGEALHHELDVLCKCWFQGSPLPGGDLRRQQLSSWTLLEFQNVEAFIL
jgi:hypothetical protein